MLTRMKGISAFGGVVVASLLLAGCTYFGADALQSNRNPYNIAIQTTNDEQLLLNLARLKYRDTPFFMQVSSVTTQFAFKPSLEVGGTLLENGPGVLGFDAGISIEERPTVSYSPLQGNEYVERYLSPIPLETIMLLYNAGWSVERVLRICVQRINDVKNAPTASGPTPSSVPDYESFLDVARAMRILQKRDLVSIGYAAEEDGKPTLVMRLHPGAKALPETHTLIELLGLAEDKDRFVISSHYLAGSTGQIGMQTRSLMGVLFYLSEAVEVPAADQERGVVTVTRNEAGEVFDWRNVTGDLLRIRSQAARPRSASVAVNHRGHWFYIDDADLSSKSTFLLLSSIVALQAGKIERVQPLFTLPLSQ